MDNSIKSLLTTGEAAELLGVSRQRIDQLITDGKLGFIARGHFRFILRSEIEKRLSLKAQERLAL